MAATGPKTEGPSMILVMGVTGSGKSYFINQLANSPVVTVGNDLHSCTTKCSAVPVNIGRTKAICLDTPGFDDTTLTNSQILEEISRILAAQYELGMSLKGVIYLHRITDIRYAGSSVKTLEIFKKICGEMALKNVILVSTRWNEVDEATGAIREQQLRDEFWAYMLGHGSTLARYYGGKDAAMAIASQLLSKQNIVLELQRELVDEKKTLKETVAGTYVSDDLSEAKAQYQRELQDLDRLRQSLRENDRAMKRTVQRDFAREEQRLQVAHADEARLRKEIAAEVRAEIEGKKKKKGQSFWSRIPILAAVVGMLELFVGIPPGSTQLVTSWFVESGCVESVAEIFASS